MRKERSRILILSAISQFALLRAMDDGAVYSGLREYRFHEEKMPAPGTLVSLQSAPPSKWYLSWVISSSYPATHACPTYDLESIEDGEPCSWSNVSLWAFPRLTSDEHPEWRWTDQQHEFNDRWLSACYNRDAYSYLPVRAEFGSDHDPLARGRERNVTISMRSRFNLDPAFCPRRYFEDWRKVTDSELRKFYDQSVLEAERKAAEAKAQRERLRFC